ncbi:MAG TPA: hypothetical protein VGY56_07710, partial [Verrucomicrobiae bacterium]|nr:hypothetical protein [Verrucomicrobiae bacterium]
MKAKRQKQQNVRVLPLSQFPAMFPVLGTLVESIVQNRADASSLPTSSRNRRKAPDVAAANKPKRIPCDHQKHICRCRDFQPASDDNFCANCACPASYHSAAALRGKIYT